MQNPHKINFQKPLTQTSSTPAKAFQNNNVVKTKNEKMGNSISNS